MTSSNCGEELYGHDGQCCGLCEAGTYKKKDCDKTTATQCAKCESGSHTAARNHMENCRNCKTCNANINQKVFKECTAQKDTVCACVTGYYCSEDQCTHCRLVSHCPEGQGVKAIATRTNDTLCSPCERGFFSNVSDHQSHCRPHTSCEDIGRVLHTPGTDKTDAICGKFINSCHWMLPAGLWIGLVVTIVLLLVAFVFWRRRHQLFRAVTVRLPKPSVEVETVVDIELKRPLPSNGHCHEETNGAAFSSDMTDFKSDYTALSCNPPDSEDSSVPITPLKASMSFTDSQIGNGISSGYGTGHYLRTFSEPQEDEWCDTEK